MQTIARRQTTVLNEYNEISRATSFKPNHHMADDQYVWAFFLRWGFMPAKIDLGLEFLICICVSPINNILKEKENRSWGFRLKIEAL